MKHCVHVLKKNQRALEMVRSNRTLFGSFDKWLFSYNEAHGWFVSNNEKSARVNMSAHTIFVVVSSLCLKHDLILIFLEIQPGKLYFRESHDILYVPMSRECGIELSNALYSKKPNLIGEGVVTANGILLNIKCFRKLMLSDIMVIQYKFLSNTRCQGGYLS
ncbi:hypothetical protein RF11_12536 [Thelohanellus kitauei]|uniref:Uncharacterized protein n=1 Tax=Thelohanellus kitauei TaxID=669202 RepID=A0A0C2M2I2_THEKT|nr:hypothetical protein RF11_12536 [Thelohanellus kitauei]